jgi:LPS O-antigen subunit length determinant protein (WzzB/FepE family)
MKPELSDKVRPKRAIMAFMGGLLGGFIGVLWVYFRSPPVKTAP